jgi:lipoprotein-releasing system permease protein
MAPGRLPGIVLGVKLAERLRAKPGSVVTLVSPLRGIDNKMLGPFGMAPTSARYAVSGIFDSGFHEYDVRLSLVDFRAAQRFLNRGDVAQWLDVRFDDVLKVKRYGRDVKAALDPYSLPDFLDATADLERRLDRIAEGDVRGYPMTPPDDVVSYLRNVTGAMHLMASQGLDFGVSDSYKLIDWEEMNHNLFSALKLQKVVLSIFFLIIIVVAAFNVVGSQIMIVHEKSSNIAILKSMGATGGQVRKIFLLQGLIVSGVGTLVGLVLGLGVCLVIDGVGYPLDPEVYLIGQLPVVIDVLESALVALGGLVFTFAAIQYSAGRASKKTPVEGLRTID